MGSASSGQHEPQSSLTNQTRAVAIIVYSFRATTGGGAVPAAVQSAMKKVILVCATPTFLAMAAGGQTPEPQVQPQMTYYTVAETGDSAGGGQTFKAFGNVSIARVGAHDYIAFRATRSDVIATFGIWTESPTVMNSLESVVLNGTVIVPGSCGDTLFNIDATQPPHIDSAGNTAFFATFLGGTCDPPPSGSQTILFHPPSSSLVLKVQDGTTVVGGETFVELDPAFGLGAGSFATEVAFSGTITSATGNKEGAWSTSSSAVLKIAQEGDPAPETVSALFQVIRGDLLIPKYNSALRTGFRAQASPPSMKGVWTAAAPPAPGQMVFNTIQGAAPGALVPFSDFKRVVINDDGNVAFRGCLDTNCNNTGIWKGGETFGLSLVAKSGGPAPGTTGTFKFFEDPALNNSGNVAFRATLETSLDDGIWAENFPGSALRCVVKKGDALRGTSLTFKEFDPTVEINSSGEVVFTAFLSDDTHALFWATPDFSPGVFKIVRESEFFDTGSGPPKKIQFLGGMQHGSILFFPGTIEQGVSGFTHDGGTPSRSSLAYRLVFEDDMGEEIGQAIVVTTIQN